MAQNSQPWAELFICLLLPENTRTSVSIPQGFIKVSHLKRHLPQDSNAYLKTQRTASHLMEMRDSAAETGGGGIVSSSLSVGTNSGCGEWLSTCLSVYPITNAMEN